MMLTDELKITIAMAVVNGILDKDEDGEPTIWYTEYDKTPIYEAFPADGELHPMEITNAVMAALHDNGMVLIPRDKLELMANAEVSADERIAVAQDILVTQVLDALTK